jgi:hypothetical protein
MNIEARTFVISIKHYQKQKDLIITSCFLALMKETILKFALKNAYNYNGSVNPKAVLGQVLRENQELKKKVPKVLEEINKIIKEEIEGLGKEDIEVKKKDLAPEL